MTGIAPLLAMLTILATAVMAASAAIQGLRQGFDPFGTTVLAIVTAVGGGTLRDLLIGATPVFWLQDPIYLATAIPVALLTHVFGRGLKKGNGRRHRLLLYFDAVGLALFTIVGVQVALSADMSMVNAILLGCITGVAGGMFRDLLCGLQPSVLRQDLYATISLVGGLIYALGADYFSREVNMALAFVLMTVMRFIVVYRAGVSTLESKVASD